MKESIYTIPISEAFETGGGCPFCKIRSRLESHFAEYITGPAMMEPDVRIKTNESGFCGRHYDAMLGRRNRLSVALMIKTHMEWLCGDLGSKPRRTTVLAKKQDSANRDCFLCDIIGREFDRILDNVAVIWTRENDFRALYERQEYICLPDLRAVTAAARKNLRGKNLDGFLSVTTRLAMKRISELKSDIDAFCNLYDYRNASKKAPDEKTALAVERSIRYLTGASDD